MVRAQIIWDKTRLVIGRGDYHWQHEPAGYAVRKGRKGHWAGDRKQTTVWQIPHRRNESGHGTEKPVECMQRPIENNSSPGQAVYEPFCGSGTTIIAAEMTGRSLPCHRARSGLCRCCHPPLAGLHWRAGGAGRQWLHIRPGHGRCAARQHRPPPIGRSPTGPLASRATPASWRRQVADQASASS